MRNQQFRIYLGLKKNQRHRIIYYKQNVRSEKTFPDFAHDIDRTILKLNTLLHNQEEDYRIGIIGSTSYMWMVLDHACIKGGYESVALPETFSAESLNKIIADLNVHLVLIDAELKDKYFSLSGCSKVYFNATEEEQDNLDRIAETKVDLSENKIREEYSVVFSSGTSQNIKYIKRKFFELKKSKTNLIKKIRLYWDMRQSVWYVLRKRNNKIIIFLPFSHPMQRDFVRTALAMGMDIVLSDAQNCIKHIILEKPNIMVSVPPVYDALAELIKARIKQFTTFEKRLYAVFLFLRLNRRRNDFFLKKIFAGILFKKLKKVYGGRADLFVTGSAPIKRETLQVFYNVGVKLYEGYSQSELSALIINSPGHFKLGSVGKPPKRLKLKIGDQSEILLKYNEEFDGINKSVLRVDEDNYIHTGDTGYLDKDGYLFITGRLDDVIVLGKGKKVFPQKVEEKIVDETDAKSVLVFSPDQNDLNAIVFSKSATIESIQHQLAEVNKTLASFEQIRKCVLVNDEPSVENSLLTSTLKLKRKMVLEKYKDHDFSVIQLVS